MTATYINTRCGPFACAANFVLPSFLFLPPNPAFLLLSSVPPKPTPTMNHFAAISRRLLTTSRPSLRLLATPRRHASVLASMPAQASESDLSVAPSPPVCPTGAATLSSEPLTATSNNAFHPANLPKGTRARLTMSELVRMLEASREILGFLEKQCAETKEEQEKTRSMVEALVREHRELRERMAESRRMNTKDERDKE
ncbi:hypothetical protein BC938DRAFT_473670 [Jimgerdemannia flammicorona]|uniref:Uncharacterized protein n=1 Tax=Jimgerdemannia flammicorona TaxID=994334 RepID=A0A433Q3I7_9FUNG|nr:hypothetical protein BC938DRAFT_473670 [Jimgerdemannia flammicorona]